MAIKYVVSRRPSSHTALGKVDLPVTLFSLVAGFDVTNEGDTAGLLAVKMNLSHKKGLGSDDTWYRFTPLVDDNVSPGPNIITDKLYEFSDGRFRGRMSYPVPPKYESLLLDPGVNTIVVAGLVIPGANAGEEVKRFWDKEAAGNNFKVDVWLWLMTKDGIGLKEIATHTYQDAFSFTNEYVAASGMVLTDEGLLAAGSF